MKAKDFRAIVRSNAENIVPPTTDSERSARRFNRGRLMPRRV